MLLLTGKLKGGKSQPMALRLDTPVQYLKGVGPKLGDLFYKRDIKTVGDLLEFYPRAYEDQRAARNIASLRPDEIVSLRANIVKVNSVPLGNTNRKIYDVVLKDSSGQIHCKFFRVPYKGYFQHFQPMQEVRVVGKVTSYRGRIEFHHPDIKDVEADDIPQDSLVPIYTEMETLTRGKILKLIQGAFPQVEKEDDAFPEWLRKEHNLLTKQEALYQLHHPNADEAKAFIEGKSRAHQRIIFEEFFWLELFLASRRSGFKKEKAPLIENEGQLMQKILQSLPFELTGAQKKTFDEIKADLKKGSPMHRMVQGDVGSGKTMVAFMSMAYSVESGFQAAMMAPTEILAEQHFKNAQKFLAPAGLRLALLTGKTKTAERKQILADLEGGEIDVIIGTHALIEDPVKFKNLGLVIVDEQHRFGVEQRGNLKRKGEAPHFLVMTATPIPRTLAMTVYGDLDVSIIDEIPPGRAPIQTRVVFENKRPQALQFMLEQIKKGRQAYIVYPLVEESEKLDLKNAVTEFEKLKTQFPDVRFDLLHGRQKPEEKEQIMEKFRRHETDVLVSTTVIEVGVDVPNANIMIVEHAERFGLSQLHQLRGRVGRGTHKSFCVLILGYAVGEDAKTRTQIMEQTTDGFKIAEYDLEIRGPGEFMGRKQSGLSGFKMANLVRDQALLQKARAAAFAVLQKDPHLKYKDHEKLREELLRKNGPAALAGIA
jgi:ATP-dependent DNA helicase RecG